MILLIRLTELTEREDKNILINPSHIEHMVPSCEGTFVRLTNSVVYVKESMYSIMALMEGDT